jgi:hypothetical protein
MSDKKIGRPTLYKPEYCDLVVELGKKGFSREAIVAELDIHYNTLNLWAEHNDEFMEALERAKNFELAFWERIAMDNIVERPNGSKVNANLWSRSMSARFPAKYRDNSKVEVTGKNDGAIQVDVVHDFAQELMNEVLSIRQDDSSTSNP